jgi:glycosyltransferase involved in cell wall biosynthesis
LVALPSFSEGIPNVLRKGLRCGQPFVATQVGGIPEIAHPSFSRLVPPGSATEFAAAVAEVLAAQLKVEPELVRRYNLTPEESARQLADCLRAACNGRRPCATVRNQTSDAADHLASPKRLGVYR